MNNLLLVIDLQENFINDNSKNVPNSIKKLIDGNIANHVVFTKFINDDISNFYKILNYKGCMNEEDRNIVIDTDACVLKTALDLFENNFDVKVIEDCSISHSGIEYHNFVINMLKKLIGIQNVIKMLGSVNND